MFPCHRPLLLLKCSGRSHKVAKLLRSGLINIQVSKEKTGLFAAGEKALRESRALS